METIKYAFIYQNRNHYIVRFKTIKGVKKSFGTYKTIEEALRCRALNIVKYGTDTQKNKIIGEILHLNSCVKDNEVGISSSLNKQLEGIYKEELADKEKERIIISKKTIYFIAAGSFVGFFLYLFFINIMKK